MILARLARRQTGIHRRGRRHERQPRLYRRQAAGLALLSHRPFSKDPSPASRPSRTCSRCAILPTPIPCQARNPQAQRPGSCLQRLQSPHLPRPAPPELRHQFPAHGNAAGHERIPPEAIRFWQQQTGGNPPRHGCRRRLAAARPGPRLIRRSSPQPADFLPGSAVSMQLIRGDLEVSATCTVTYVDPHQLLACGHPVLQAGPVSLPMTTADVIATLASPLMRSRSSIPAPPSVHSPTIENLPSAACSASRRT